jgi:mRNA-degrading endonuclease YafQ of YafQ-DinJ toxin-antitoxin module
VSVIFKTCKLFDETKEKHFRNAKIKEAFGEFLKLKSKNPMEKFGSKDTPFAGNGPFHGLLHAALSNDIRIIYELKGKNPTTLFIYYVGTHDESGTGQPANIKRQKQLKSRIDNQVFESEEDLI